MNRRILIVRRENIGDLVCTTPLIAALRARFPDAFLAVLANSYNAPILDHHPDLDAVYAYTKGKHAGSAMAAGKALLARAGLLWRLRGRYFDDIVLADPTYVPRNLRLARWLRGGRKEALVIGFAAPDGTSAGLDRAFPVAGHEGLNMVELVFRLGRAWGIDGTPPPTHIVGGAARAAGADAPVGLHISARLPSQRWPAERFAELARRLHQRHGVRFRLFWSPGDEDHPQHPGDDRKAREVLALAAGVPIAPAPTAVLQQLVDGVESCRMMICADGGAMHIAAGLGKPIVCLFGESDARTWYPWGVPYRLLQAPSRSVLGIGVEEVVAAFGVLWEEMR